MAVSKSESSGAAKRRVGERFNPHKEFHEGIFIPESLCRLPGLSLGAKLVWGRLKRYSGQNGSVYPSLSMLGKEVAISKDQTRRYIRELQKKEFIYVDQNDKHFYANGAGGTPHYYFLWHACFAVKTQVPLADAPGVPITTLQSVPLAEVPPKESKSKRATTTRLRTRPLNAFDLDNYGDGFGPAPLVWEQARNLRRMERDLPLEEIERNARAEIQSGRKRTKWSRIYAERTLT